MREQREGEREINTRIHMPKFIELNTESNTAYTYLHTHAHRKSEALDFYQRERAKNPRTRTRTRTECNVQHNTKREITMTHLMKADFQFLFILHLFPFVRSHEAGIFFPPLYYRDCMVGLMFLLLLLPPLLPLEHAGEHTTSVH